MAILRLFSPGWLISLWCMKWPKSLFLKACLCCMNYFFPQPHPNYFLPRANQKFTNRFRRPITSKETTITLTTRNNGPLYYKDEECAPVLLPSSASSAIKSHFTASQVSRYPSAQNIGTCITPSQKLPKPCGLRFESLKCNSLSANVPLTAQYHRPREHLYWRCAQADHLH